MAGNNGDLDLPPEESPEPSEEWFSELDRPEDFYSDAALYWESIPSTINGMLGGFGRISRIDAAGSKEFLLPFITGPSALVKPNRALDCGAGIGRVTKTLLLPLFSEVDLVEQNPAFLEKAKISLGPSGSKIGNYFAVGLQDFTPEDGRYDIIWIQWVAGHLKDDDLVAFLKKCQRALNPNGGLIFLKENITTEEDVFDEKDSSITRSYPLLLQLLEKAGLFILKEKEQENFPKPLFAVKMFALKAVKYNQH